MRRTILMSILCLFGCDHEGVSNIADGLTDGDSTQLSNSPPAGQGATGGAPTQTSFQASPPSAVSQPDARANGGGVEPHAQVQENGVLSQHEIDEDDDTSPTASVHDGQAGQQTRPADGQDRVGGLDRIQQGGRDTPLDLPDGQRELTNDIFTGGDDTQIDDIQDGRSAHAGTSHTASGGEFDAAGVLAEDTLSASELSGGTQGPFAGGVTTVSSGLSNVVHVTNGGAGGIEVQDAGDGRQIDGNVSALGPRMGGDQEADLLGAGYDHGFLAGQSMHDGDFTSAIGGQDEGALIMGLINGGSREAMAGGMGGSGFRHGEGGAQFAGPHDEAHGGSNDSANGDAPVAGGQAALHVAGSDAISGRQTHDLQDLQLDPGTNCNNTVSNGGETSTDCNGTMCELCVDPSDSLPSEAPFRSIPARMELISEVIAARNLRGANSTHPHDEHPDGRDPSISESDTLGDLAIVALWYQNGYYTNGVYNDNDWRVQQSQLTGFGSPLPMYTVEPSTHRASAFLASRHALFYRVPSGRSITVWEATGGTLRILERLEGSGVDAGGFQPLTTLVANDITEPRSFVFAPSNMTLSTLQSIGDGVEGQTLSQTDVGQVVQVRYRVPGTPYTTGREFIDGPENWRMRYGNDRHFFPVHGRGQEIGVVWQDMSIGQVRVTWMNRIDPGQYRTVRVPSLPNTTLAAATGQGGDLIYLLIETGDGAPLDNRSAWLLKSDDMGQELVRVPLDTSEQGLNIAAFGSAFGNDAIRYRAALSWQDDTVGLMLGRKMLQGSDGLNHQGGIAAVYSADTLETIVDHGQTSGHSFCNVLTSASDGSFLGLDLGDNYPRGVHLHRFDDQGITSRVVYTVKTRHGTNATNPAGLMFDVYQAISDEQQTFYQWSNDNETYSELGGLVETSAGLVVVISSEVGLDNALVGHSLNAPRNLGLLLVNPGFDALPRPEHTHRVSDDLILSQGAVPQEGGFFDFRGGWRPQRNVGVVWLTAYDDLNQNASRVKVHGLDGERLLILWEAWTQDRYTGTFGMIVNSAGTVLVPATPLHTQFRLGYRDDPFPMAGGIANIAGEGPKLPGEAPFGYLILTLVLP